MSFTDPIGDMLARIRNAQERGKSKVTTPASKAEGRDMVGPFYMTL